MAIKTVKNITEGNGCHIELTTITPIEGDKDVVEVDHPELEASNKPIICSKCIGTLNTKYTGCHESMAGHCIWCSRFYKKPESLKDWFVYYKLEVIGRVRYRIYMVKKWFRRTKWKHCNMCSIPSVIGEGSVIKYKILWKDGEYAQYVAQCKALGNEPHYKEDDVHTHVCGLIHVGYEPSTHTFHLYDGHNCIQNAFDCPLDKIDIISIDGKKSYVVPNSFI